MSILKNGVLNADNLDAHYVLSNLSLTCEVYDIPENKMSEMASQTSGAMEFNTISSLYTTFNTSNAQIQYDVGLKNLQSAFVTFCPSENINTVMQPQFSFSLSVFGPVEASYNLRPSWPQEYKAIFTIIQYSVTSVYRGTWET